MCLITRSMSTGDGWCTDSVDRSCCVSVWAVYPLAVCHHAGPTPVSMEGHVRKTGGSTPASVRTPGLTRDTTVNTVSTSVSVWTLGLTRDTTVNTGSTSVSVWTLGLTRDTTVNTVSTSVSVRTPGLTRNTTVNTVQLSVSGPLGSPGKHLWTQWVQLSVLGPLGLSGAQLWTQYSVRTPGLSRDTIVNSEYTCQCQNPWAHQGHKWTQWVHLSVSGSLGSPGTQLWTQWVLLSLSGPLGSQVTQLWHGEYNCQCQELWGWCQELWAHQWHNCQHSEYFTCASRCCVMLFVLTQ